MGASSMAVVAPASTARNSSIFTGTGTRTGVADVTGIGTPSSK